jgi:Tfp pilus assembly protein PilN
VIGAAANLASRPFANTRPLRRVALALWLAGAVLMGVAGYLYWRSLFGIEGGRAQIADVDRSIAAERRRLEAAEAALARMDLRRQNAEAAYLEARVRERAFPWSALFEHLAEVLPRKVRLVSLSPQSADPRATTRSRRPASVSSAGRVYLQMTGAAANDEALTDLLDRLFASRWFERPTLPAERRESGQIGFALGVSYLPGGPRGVAAAPTMVPLERPAPSASMLTEAAPDGSRSPGGAR